MQEPHSIQPSQRRDHPRSFAASRVRANAGSAGFAAACLLYFGFFSFAPGAGTDLLNVSWSAAYYTFRIGGVLLAIVAVGSLSGWSAILLMDAALSAVIGAALLFCAVTRIGPSSLEAFIFIIAAAMFLRSAWHNGQAYFAAGRGGSVSALHPPPIARRADASEASSAGFRSTGVSDSMAAAEEATVTRDPSRLTQRLLDERRRGTGDPQARTSSDAVQREAGPPVKPQAPPQEDVPPQAAPRSATASTPQPPPPTPPGGFLASFAPKDES